MLSWIVVAILMIIGLMIIKVINIRHKFFIIMIIFLTLFLYITINIVSEKNDLSLSTTEGFFNSVRVYIGWLANGVKNLNAIVGRAIEMDWKSTNETFFRKNQTKK